jgi:anti-sigma regulatory factor (Ser/Thr protein kinase)
MRRNAESLLVLAGIEPPRQWAAPVQLSDVVRAALGEVEDYQRVIVRHLEPASVTGAVAADIAHVMAELLENALSFSPPDQSVEIKGRLTIEGYTLAISDNGLGMSAAEVAQANRRLAGEESFTVAPSRYLGHYVAGHLASRLGVVVELQDSPAGGITARLDVPMGLLANEETDPYLTKMGAQQPAAPAAVEAEMQAPAAAPELPAPAPSVTASGLPRRGQRPVEGIDIDLDSSTSAPVPAPREPAPTPEIETIPSWEPASASSWEAAEPVVAPAVDDPALDPLSERIGNVPASGFGGLAVTRPSGPSLFSIAAQNARNGRAAPASAGEDTTATGLTRRVPGAQRPDATFETFRAAESQPTDPEPPRSSPEDVYSFLSSFQSGVARGRADAHTDPESTEDER